jgi:hypothetical protein
MEFTAEQRACIDEMEASESAAGVVAVMQRHVADVAMLAKAFQKGFRLPLKSTRRGVE